MKNFVRSLFLSVFAFWMITASAQNWPQFRGSNSNQLIDDSNLPLEWDNNTNLAWKVELEGRGWSSPIIWEDKVFYTTAVIDKSSVPDSLIADSRGKELNPKEAVYSWQVHCLDLNTGKEIWQKVAYEGNPGIPTHPDNTYASETPVTDGERLYVYFGMNGLYCFDLEGTLLWKKDMGAYLSTSNWGTSTSPLVYNDVLYMQIDSDSISYLEALDSRTGKQIWRVERDEPTNWSTPIIWKNKLRTELVTSGQKARSYDPASGKLLWELHLGGGRNITSPVPDEEMILLGNEERRDGGGILYAVKAGAEGDISLNEDETSNSSVIWSRKKSAIAMASPLLHDGLVYVVERRRGQIFCYEAATGETVYEGIQVPEAGPFWASPWASKDRIYCLDEEGKTFVIQPGREFKVLSVNKLDDKIWPSVAVSNDSYIFRGVSHIWCVRK